MKKVSAFFYDNVTLMSCIIATLIMVGYASFVMGGFSSCFEIEGEGPSSLGLSFGYSFETVLQFFTNRDSEAIRCYVDFISIWDNIFPLLYSAMYILWISYLWKNVNQSRPRLRLINLFPLLMILMDWSENFMEVQMATYYLTNQTLLESQASFASFISITKWMGSTICYAIIIVGIFIRLKPLFQKSDQK